MRSTFLPALLVLLLAAGCATTEPPAPAPEPDHARPTADDRPYLVSPLEGWSAEVDPQRRRLLAEGFAAVESADVEGARAAVAELGGAEGVAAEPPVTVLAAQADLVDRRPGAAVARLEPLAPDLPAYTALQLLLGRAAEATGDLVTAFAAFHRAAGASLLAFDRVEELRPRVAEVLANRVDEAVRRGEPEAAEEILERLRGWAPETVATWEAAMTLARARRDRDAELAAARELAGLQPEDRELVERWAELELAVGDPKTGLDVFESLAAGAPDDPRLRERLAYAKFRWRVAQMPPRVTEVASKPELERGDLAVLLYWLVPRVRSGRPAAARIASDILDDPRREEIARVVNLDLMDVNRSLHLFYPLRQATRGEAVDALLRVLAVFGEAPCATSLAEDGGRRPSEERTCELALGCGLVRPDELCAPREPLSGAAAVELIRRVLDDLDRLRLER